MTQSTAIYCSYLHTPIGDLEIRGTETVVLSIYFVEHRSALPENDLSRAARLQLQEYFAGSRTEFDLPTQAKGTNFQQNVWQQLKNIPFGHTCSYKDIADELNNPKAVRAVGAANGRNPLSIVVPCHRVVGANGTLTGYAGGLERKAWLLQHEKSQTRGSRLN